MKQDVVLERLGVTVTVDSSTAKPGGEAMVAFVRVGARDLAVKLFHAPSESEPVRMDRLAAWIARPGRYPDPDGYLPWAPPQGKVCDAATGRVLGCWMYAVDVLGDLESFVDLSSPNLWDYPRIAAFAGAAAAALAELEAHPLKPKPCDLSLSNLLVDRLGRPVFVDLDSFQVTVVRGGRATPLLSPAHLPAYLPRELQGLDLRVVERTAAHHRFAAAVLIYQLLMGLWHPYATVPAGDVEDRIAQGAFSFAPASGFAPPPGAVPGWDRLGPRMRDLFFRAFVDGAIDPDARPSLEEFRDELAGEAARARSGPQAPAAQARRSRPPRGAIRCKAAGAALAFPRWRSAFKRIAMRPPHIAIPRVSPRAAAAAVVVGLVVFVGLALAVRLAAPPVRVVDPKEIAKIRAATSRRDAPTAPATTTPADPTERAGKAPPEIERLRPPRPFPEAFSTTDPRSHR